MSAGVTAGTSAAPGGESSSTTAVPDSGNSGGARGSTALDDLGIQSIALISLLAVVVVVIFVLCIMRLKLRCRLDAQNAGYAERAAAKKLSADEAVAPHNEELAWEDTTGGDPDGMALHDWLRKTSQAEPTERPTRVHMAMESFSSNGSDMWDVLDVGTFAGDHTPLTVPAQDAATMKSTRLAVHQLSFSNRIAPTDVGGCDGSDGVTAADGVDLCVIDGAITTKLPALASSIANSTEMTDQHLLTTPAAPSALRGTTQESKQGRGKTRSVPRVSFVCDSLGESVTG